MRLPPNTRRLLRLVSRHWRDVVGERTATSLRSRAKTLIATTTGSPCVVDDLSSSPAPGTSHRNLWADWFTEMTYKGTSVVGTCNGLVCLYANRAPGGAITVIKPDTPFSGLAIPPLPPPPSLTADRCSLYNRGRQEAYSFAYLPTTRRYSVVHVPCHVNRSVYDAVHVFTLGEASWREVPAEPAARCDLAYGVVSVDGATYWVAAPEGTEKVMFFDLEDERVMSITTLPSALSRSKDGGSWHLAEVEGRLGIVFTHASSAVDKIEVWVLEGARGGRKIRWSRCHTPTNNPKKAKRGVVNITEENRGTRVTNMDIAGYDDVWRTFGYVETNEPLSIYKINLRDQLIST
uniref:F-box associated beta-propeller type 3 domain-containing protein n=1 Tax=Hordeum vulgare subsp. vulgare TaxID=112509 RepID=A0A8I6YCC9_HORVV